MIDLIAYIGSAFILVSFMLKDQIKLRILNSIGALIFIYYSVYKGDYPVIFINSSIVIINLIYIIKNTKWKKDTKNVID
jgi:hypothetical protein